MTSLTIEQKRVDIYPSAKPGSPVIYLNTFSNAVNSVYKNLMALGCPDFCLVAVSELKWDHDMTPWYMGPISKHDTPCTGGADDYLKLLLDEIMPEAEALLPGAPAWRGLAGYSLAGLFALYALYQTDVFARAASMSGSFWFEGIMEYVCSHEMNVVQQNTQEIETLCHGKGIETTFVLNSGSHYQACNKRTAAGIHWILNR